MLHKRPYICVYHCLVKLAVHVAFVEVESISILDNQADQCEGEEGFTPAYKRIL